MHRAATPCCNAARVRPISGQQLVVIGAVDSPCWGERAAPLVPEAWLPHVGSVALPLTSTKYVIGQATIATAREKRLGWIWPDAPAAVVGDALAAQLDPEDPPDWLDHPLGIGAIAAPAELASLPLLTTTWAAIEATFPGRAGLADFAALLHTGTALECLQQLRSVSAVLDVAITVPAWLVRRGSRWRVWPPRTPVNLDEAFLLAARRHLQTAALPPRYVEHDDWCRAIGARVGLSPRGKLTLQEAGEIVGVTRERMRQIETPQPMHHRLRRRWPLGDVMTQVHDMLSFAIDQRVSVSRPTFESLGFDASVDVHAVAATLLDAYGAPVLVHVDGGRVLRSGTRPRSEAGLDRKTVRDVAWEVSKRTGVLRMADLIDTLARRSGAPLEQVEAAARAALDMTDLPDGHAVVIRERDMQLFAIPRRMLTWHSPLTIAQLHAGLTRRMRMHHKHTLPPPAMLREMLVRHDDFVVILDFVALAQPEPPDTTSIVGWISEQIRTSPWGALHRATILDRARRAGFNHSSVLVYLTFGDTIVSAGNGCVALVGSRVDPAAIALARKDAAQSFVAASVEMIADGDDLVLRCIVGTHNRVGGQITVTKEIERRLDAGKYRVHAVGMERGSVGLSHHNLYGLGSAFNALAIEPGDEIDIRFDLEAATATVTLADRDVDPLEPDMDLHDEKDSTLFQT